MWQMPVIATGGGYYETQITSPIYIILMTSPTISAEIVV